VESVDDVPATVDTSPSESFPKPTDETVATQESNQTPVKVDPPIAATPRKVSFQDEAIINASGSYSIGPLPFLSKFPPYDSNLEQGQDLYAELRAAELSAYLSKEDPDKQGEESPDDPLAIPKCSSESTPDFSFYPPSNQQGSMSKNVEKSPEEKLGEQKEGNSDYEIFSEFRDGLTNQIDVLQRETGRRFEEIAKSTEDCNAKVDSRLSGIEDILNRIATALPTAQTVEPVISVAGPSGLQKPLIGPAITFMPPGTIYKQSGAPVKIVDIPEDREGYGSDESAEFERKLVEAEQRIKLRSDAEAQTRLENEKARAQMNALLDEADASKAEYDRKVLEAKKLRDLITLTELSANLGGPKPIARALQFTGLGVTAKDQITPPTAQDTSSPIPLPASVNLNPESAAFQPGRTPGTTVDPFRSGSYPPLMSSRARVAAGGGGDPDDDPDKGKKDGMDRDGRKEDPPIGGNRYDRDPVDPNRNAEQAGSSDPNRNNPPGGSGNNSSNPYANLPPYPYQVLGQYSKEAKTTPFSQQRPFQGTPIVSSVQHQAIASPVFNSDKADRDPRDFISRMERFGILMSYPLSYIYQHLMPCALEGRVARRWWEHRGKDIDVWDTFKAEFFRFFLDQDKEAKITAGVFHDKMDPDEDAYAFILEKKKLINRYFYGTSEAKMVDQIKGLMAPPYPEKLAGERYDSFVAFAHRIDYLRGDLALARAYVAPKKSRVKDEDTVATVREKSETAKTPWKKPFAKPYVKAAAQSSAASGTPAKFDRYKAHLSDRGARVCFNCREPGHMIKDCPKPRVSERRHNANVLAISADCPHPIDPMCMMIAGEDSDNDDEDDDSVDMSASSQSGVHVHSDQITGN